MPVLMIILALLVIYAVAYIAFVVFILGALVYGLIHRPKETIGFVLLMLTISFVTQHPYLASSLGALFVGYLVWKRGRDKAAEGVQLQLPLGVEASNPAE